MAASNPRSPRRRKVPPEALSLLCAYLERNMRPRDRVRIMRHLSSMVETAQTNPPGKWPTLLKATLSMTAPSLKGKGSKRKKADPWIASAFEMLVHAYRAARGNVKAVRSILKKEDRALAPILDAVRVASLETALWVPINRLLAHDLEGIAKGVTAPRDFALAVLAAEMRLQGDAPEDAALAHVKRARTRQLAELNAIRTKLGLAPCAAVPAKRLPYSLEALAAAINLMLKKNSMTATERREAQRVSDEARRLAATLS
jgi:hypothetical protein